MAEITEVIYDPSQGVDFSQLRNEVLAAAKLNMPSHPPKLRTRRDPSTNNPIGLVVLNHIGATQDESDSFLVAVDALDGVASTLKFAEPVLVSILQQWAVNPTEAPPGTFDTDVASLPSTPSITQNQLNEFDLNGPNGDIPGSGFFFATLHRGFMGSFDKTTMLTYLTDFSKNWIFITHGNDTIKTSDSDEIADSFVPARRVNHLDDRGSFNAVDNDSKLGSRRRFSLMELHAIGSDISQISAGKLDIVTTGSASDANRQLATTFISPDVLLDTTSIEDKGIEFKNAIAANPLDGTREGMIFKAGGRWYTVQLTGQLVADHPGEGFESFYDTGTSSFKLTWKTAAANGLPSSNPAINMDAFRLDQFGPGIQARLLRATFLIGVPQGGDDAGPVIEGKPSTLCNLYPFQFGTGLLEEGMNPSFAV